MAERIGVGVVGLGFMGQTHIRAYQAAAAAGLPCELVAVCDKSEERLRGGGDSGGNLETGASGGGFDLRNVRGYRELDEFLADPRVSLVSVCTYTDSHVEVASRALQAGKHVLVEKPVAVSSVEVRRLAFEAEESGRLCMPAMCMRFWSGWDWVREKIRSGAYDAAKSAQFQRMGAGPSWGAAFYRDFSRSGGALWDLHIHDADFIYWCFGKPASVTSTGTLEHLTTLYRFADGPQHVSAEGAWGLPPSAGFRMKYLITFERAAVEFDLAQGVTVWQEGEPERVTFDGMTAYERQVRYFVEAVARGETELRATMADALAVAELLEAERRSMESGEPVAL
jgi:predicted dehydrogenase